MASVNKVILIGNCGRDPEVRYTPGGTAICNVSVATSSRRKDKASGESIEDTQWHRVIEVAGTDPECVEIAKRIGMTPPPTAPGYSASGCGKSLAHTT